MPLTLDELDSPLIPDGQASFIGGQFSNAIPLTLDQTQAAKLEDVEIAITGAAMTRRGTAQLGPNVDTGAQIRGLAYYSTGAISAPVALSGQRIKKFDGTNWVDLGSSRDVATLSGPVQIIEGSTFLYVTDASGKISKFDGTTWTDLTDTDHPPHDVKYLIWHSSNRLIAANVSIWNGSAYVASVDSVIFWGILDDTFAPATLLGGYQLQIGAGDGQPITGIASWQNNILVVFKRNSTWVIGSDPLLDVAAMSVNRVHDKIGCIANRTIAQVGNDVFFLSRDGVRSLQQTIATNDRQDLGAPVSFPVGDIIRRINLSAIDTACAIFWNNLYILALPLDTATAPSYILVYNTLISKWSGGWTNLPVSCMAVRTDTGVDKLMLGLSTSPKVIQWLDYVLEANTTDVTFQDYNGTYVQPHIVSRGMISGDLDSPKKGLSCNIKFNKSKGNMTVKALFDEGASSATQILSLGDPFGFPIPFTLPIRFPVPGVQPGSMSLLPYPHYHQIQIELTGTLPGRKEVRQIAVQAFPEPMDMRGAFQSSIPPQ